MDVGPLARIYATLERVVYGGGLQVARCAHLNEIPLPRRVLIVGEGDGRFLQAFLEKFDECERIDVIEPSARMCEMARGRIGERGMVNFHQCAFEAFEAEGKYDLIVAHFFFDCFDPPEQKLAAGRMAAMLESGGTLLVADFQMPENGWFPRIRARVLLRVMYGFFRLSCGLRTKALSDPEGALREAGLGLDARVVSKSGFLRSDRWGKTVDGRLNHESGGGQS